MIKDIDNNKIDKEEIIQVIIALAVIFLIFGIWSLT